MDAQPDHDDPFVRPFMITSGRTTGMAGDIPIEAMFVAIKPTDGLQPDPARVVALCTTAMSIAEIGALLRFPIGVARVLVADLVASRHVNRCDVVSVDDETVLRRLLNGIRAL